MPQGETVDFFVSDWTQATGTRPGERQVADPEPSTSNTASSAPSAHALQPTQTAASEHYGNS